MVELLRLFRGITPPMMRQRPLAICENLTTFDAIYPVIREEINDWLKTQGYEPWVGMPGWTSAMPDPPIIDPTQDGLYRDYSFMDWFEPLLKNSKIETEFIRVRKEAVCGAPFFSADYDTKLRIYDHVCKVKDYGYFIDNKDMLYHALAARLQTNDPWGKKRETPRYIASVSELFDQTFAIETAMEELNPYDETLANIGLQKPRGRTPRMVSLYINLPLMRHVQAYRSAKSFDLPNGSKISFSNDPNQIESYLNDGSEYLFWIAFDRKKSEFNTSPASIRQTTKFVGNAPLDQFILNWYWNVRGILFRDVYMGNPSGISTVLLTNNIETLALLTYLGYCSSTGLINCKAVILGDAAAVGFLSMQDLNVFKEKVSHVDTVNLEEEPKIGQKKIVYNETNASFSIAQSPVTTLMSFWAPEYDAGGKSRPFYGIGRKQRWIDFHGDIGLRDLFLNFENSLISKYRLNVLEKTPPTPTAYDAYSYYWLMDAGREEEAKLIEPFIFNHFRIENIKLD
jgi:hypothetical protein